MAKISDVIVNVQLIGIGGKYRLKILAFIARLLGVRLEVRKA